MKRFVVLILALGLVLFTSGCVEGGGLAGIMGVGTEEEEAPSDVLEVADKNVIPNPPIASDSGFEFSFLVKNLYENEDTEGVDVELYDWGMCNRTEGSDIRDDDIYRGGEREVRWNFETPDSEDMGHMPRDCSLRFRVSYTFDARSTHDLYLVTQDHVREMDRRGESIGVSPTASYADGPIKAYIDFWGDQPLIEETDVGFDIYMENTGEGKMGTELGTEDITIKHNGEEIKDFYTEEQDNGGKYCIWPMRNTDKTLYFSEGSTPRISCVIEDATIEGPGPVEEQTVQVEINDYEYELLHEHSVEVEP
ncbi:MAG: hypothetical protein ACLFTQ_01750 [Candidatus Aenigmatarchaeota archaeon]